jgi:hypothetical protein
MPSGSPLTQTLGLTTHMSDARLFFNLAIGASGFLALISPILISLVLVLFRGKLVRGRWLFLLVGPVLAYTILWVFTLVFIVPATFVLVLLAPGTQATFNQMPYWFHLAAWVTKYQYLLAALTCGALATWIAVWLWPRWPNILYALAQPPESRPSVQRNPAVRQ